MTVPVEDNVEADILRWTEVNRAYSPLFRVEDVHVNYRRVGNAKRCDWRKSNVFGRIGLGELDPQNVEGYVSSEIGVRKMSPLTVKLRLTEWQCEHRSNKGSEFDSQLGR